MQTGAVTWTIASPLLDTFFRLEGQLLVGKARSKLVLLSPQPRPSTLRSQVRTAQESLWLQQLLSDLNKEQMVIYEDNQSAISMARNPQFHGRSKHNRDQVSEGKIDLKYCNTSDMVAYIMNKGLSGEQLFLRN